MNVIKLCAAAVLALCAVMILRDSKHPHPEYIVMSVGAIVAVRVIGNLSSAVECLRCLGIPPVTAARRGNLVSDGFHIRALPRRRRKQNRTLR